MNVYHVYVQQPDGSYETSVFTDKATAVQAGEDAAREGQNVRVTEELAIFSSESATPRTVTVPDEVNLSYSAHLVEHVWWMHSNHVKMNPHYEEDDKEKLEEEETVMEPLIAWLKELADAESAEEGGDGTT